ncbi:unnamed protein product [Didymodactylos carnosus]|uniref:phosphoinositide phospholipase C n=1 Tax=Didymodactylos carnosus TaxID=1234261 RepID=A0A8S2EJN4_9BILA|nr:unnamed protein product [Didymodactylos carnosus]CAF4049506.1 unnamed protein product [Didymodactylos carnosus]
MHVNHARFLVNGNCGYVLMPLYIRTLRENIIDVSTSSMIIKLKILAFRHIRTISAKSITKARVFMQLISTLLNGTSTTYSSIIKGPCGIWKACHNGRDLQPLTFQFVSSNSDLDLISFEVLTEDQEFCGQSMIPLSCLRSGIRSIQLYDKYNERIEMSSILVEINFNKLWVKSSVI